MQNFINNVTDENIDEEWSSFCSSCKSVLKSICSVGETFSLDEIIDKSTKEKDVETRIEKYKNIVETSNGINKKPNEHIPNNYIERNDFFNNNRCEKRKINEKNSDQSDSHRSKKVKCIELLNEADTYSSDRYKDVPCKVAHKNSTKITHDRNMKQKKNYRSLKAKMLFYSAKINTQSNDNFLASNVMSSIKSQSIRQNILDHRKNILKIAQSILHLSNYIDGMREMILKGIHKKRTVEKSQESVNKILLDNKYIESLANQDLPIYCYNSLYTNNK